MSKAEKQFKKLVDQWFETTDELAPDMLSYLVDKAQARKLVGVVLVISAATGNPHEKAVVAEVTGCTCESCKSTVLQAVAARFDKK